VSTRVRILALLCCVEIFLPLTGHCQESVGAVVYHFFRNALLPAYWTDTYELRAFIANCDSDLAPLRKSHLRRLDDIFNASLNFSEGDRVEALLISSIATLPYHTFPVVVPLLGWVITVPVSTECKKQFQKRLHNLPSMVFADSPAGGDRDKLPHFFGSAYLYVLTRSQPFVLYTGHGIEILEEIFKLEGAYDERDIMADSLGVEFGKALLRKDHVLPSTLFLRTSNE